MGNCVSFQISCDATLKNIYNCLFKGYIQTLKENLRDLERQIEDLRAIHDVVKNRVAREEAQHRQMLNGVEVWLTRVESIYLRVDDQLSTSPAELQKLCLCGMYSKDLCSSYKYGKAVSLLLEEVKVLKSEGNFELVTELAQISQVEERSTQPTVGQDMMVEKAWNRIMEEEVGIMGLHGMGGVGKTTLFKKIHNKFAEIAGSFDIVIWATVSQGFLVSNLQAEIGQKLNLCGDQWRDKNESDKAADLHRVLKGKRFALMMDDVWEKVNLEAIGVPFPTKENGCKIAFTTRSRKVCGQMGDHDPIHVKCLEWNEAWALFRNKVGDNILGRDVSIVQIARNVAEKCRGLPLAICIIAETMASKNTVQEWEHAIHLLTRSAAEFDAMGDKILPILKYSYDNLDDEGIKSCLLYCALFPEKDIIFKEALIEYWLCEGFLGEERDIKRAMNKGHDVLGTLIRANLLEEKDADAVGMHDVVREMALWIASCFGEEKHNFVVKSGYHNCDSQELKFGDWGAVTRLSIAGNNIEEIPSDANFSQLITLFLQNNNKLKNLSGELMRSMPNLVVLSLAYNFTLSELPEQISELASLQYLDLSFTNIETLPVGLQELKKLILLNLIGTSRLCSLSGISKLSSLIILKLELSKVVVDVSCVKELQLLKHLQVLDLDRCTELGLELISGDQRLAKCMSKLKIDDFHEKPFNLSLVVSMENLRELWVYCSHVLDSEIISNLMGRKTSWLHNPTTPGCFTNLVSVTFVTCSGFKDMTWLLFVPNLTLLDVTDSEDVEEIINNEKATNLTGITPFQKLQKLRLQNLPNLASIYWSPLPFPLLESIKTISCPKLRKLPFNATSVPRVGGLVITVNPPEMIAALEWEDEDTKNRFMPFLVSEIYD